jgi:hypothetical protein
MRFGSIYILYARVKMARESRWTVELLFSIIGIQTGVKSVPTNKQTILIVLISVAKLFVFPRMKSPLYY